MAHFCLPGLLPGATTSLLPPHLPNLPGSPMEVLKILTQIPPLGAGPHSFPWLPIAFSTNPNSSPSGVVGFL